MIQGVLPRSLHYGFLKDMISAQMRLDMMEGRLQVLLADSKLRAFAGVLQAEDLERVGRVM